MAQFQPFALQVQQPLSFSLKTGPQYGPRYSAVENNDTTTITEKKSGYESESWWRRNNYWLQIFMILAGLLALALYGVIQGFTSGRFNKWANAKSMHYTRSKESWTWVSIFPSQVYTNQDLLSQQVTYRVVDGVLDGAPPSPTELHGFQIASSAFGILPTSPLTCTSLLSC